MKLPSLRIIFSAIENSFKRFPIVFIISIIGTATYMYLIESTFSYEENQFAIKLWLLCLVALPLFLSTNLYAESAKIKDFQKYQIQMIAGLILFLHWFLLPEELGQIQYIRFFLWQIAFHLLVAFAPYIQRKSINGFWQFNQKLFIRGLLGLLYSLVLYIGMAIALLAIDQLFNADIASEVYFHLMALISGIFNTWFFLAGIPKDFDALDKEAFYPKGLKIFTQYVLLPLVTVYLTILYAYTFKIIAEWNFPKGWVSYLVIIFSTAGVFSLLLVYPIRDDEKNKWVKIYSKGFYFALFPLIVLLFIAISKRLNAYGFTENRYFIIAIAIWLSAIALYFLISKTKNIKTIPISLFFVVFLSSFGPWSAFSVAENSQFSRLKSTLSEKKILKNGKISHGKKKVKFSEDEIENIESMISFFEYRNRLEVLQPLFKENFDKLLDKDGYQNTNKLLAFIGIDKKYLDNTPISFSKEYGSKPTIKIEGYEYLKAIDLNDNQEQELNLDNKTYFLSSKFEKNSIEILSKKKKLLFILEFKSLLKKLFKKYKRDNYDIPAEELIFLQEGSNYHIKLQIEEIIVNKQDKDSFTMESLAGSLFIKIEEN